MESHSQQINKSKVSIQILETTAGMLFALRQNDKETINSVIERILAQLNNAGSSPNTNDKVDINEPIIRRFAKKIHKFRSEKIVNEEAEGKYLVTLFDVPFFAKSLGDLYARFVNIFAEIAPEAIENLRDKKTPRDSRSYLTWNPEKLFITAPHLFEKHHILTSVGYVPTNIGQNEAEGYLTALCDAAGITFGVDMIWIRNH